MGSPPPAIKPRWAAFTPSGPATSVTNSRFLFPLFPTLKPRTHGHVRTNTRQCFGIFLYETEESKTALLHSACLANDMALIHFFGSRYKYERERSVWSGLHNTTYRSLLLGYKCVYNVLTDLGMDNMFIRWIKLIRFEKFCYLIIFNLLFIFSYPPPSPAKCNSLLLSN